MGDGNVSKTGENASLRCILTEKEYLDYLGEEFGIITNRVSLCKSAKEKAKENRDSDFSPNAKENNYKDQYIWQTKTHPFFTELYNWYSEGEKVWPKEIDLSPTVLKHWYCGDGSVSYKSESDCITISAANEAENVEKIKKYFERAELPNPTISTYEREFGKTAVIRFGVGESKKLWEYMGDPINGFEYKWPLNNSC